MITKNEKAKGLWWRLLATLPVLAVLLIANTKVTAQEKDVEKTPIMVEMGKFDLYSDEGSPLPLKDTIIYNEDGSYVKCTTSDAIDPISGETRKKLTITTHNADGTPNKDMLLHWDIDEDVAKYGIEPKGSLQAFKMNIQALVDAVDTIYNTVEQMPEFPGGEQAMMKYISENVKFPEKAKEEGVMGRVFIGFVVERDGSVNEVRVLRGIGGGCDEEAVRVISSMPKWKPGMQDGKAVRVRYQIPIHFKIWDDPENTTSLANTKYTGKATGTKNGVTYTMEMTMEMESAKTGYFVMTLTSQKKKGKPVVEFQDIGLPFTYTYDGKSLGSIQPMNPDGSQLGEKPMPPYGFIRNPKGSINVNFYDFKDDIGIEEIIFKQVKE